MNNIDLLEQLLKEYSYLNQRIKFMEKLQKNYFEITSGNNKSKRDLIYNKKDFSLNKSHLDKQDIIIEDIIDKINYVENELERLKYIKRITDDCLEMLKSTNERYYKVVEKYYIHKVRMEDIAVMLYISRSRCYEICKNAIKEMAEFMFGCA